ncbi:group II intron reverse transcriptase/maturase [Catalinimonas niigatensis]|uniref:group II intron reverse transcriptase/maturase n=1 Tax=Catalinimonas niigatensis TaxID=1397264 RepID=UPI00266507D1|nr:group II intron reverse transcriptase/maturase [Catalinimonas niigatensis]WPP53637.1 group II intron reverse transcriptase/maturase [Catalinimonas niigatensis]
METYGVHRYLSELQADLRNRTYRYSPVRRVKIPKEKKGEYRMLSIPTIKDRIVQMAVKPECRPMIIEPLWEAVFIPSSYGFRPKRSAADAIKEINKNLGEGYHCIYDADLSKYFDSIPHNKLFVMLKERISDKGILDIIGQWLTAPIQLENAELLSNHQGTPQGGVVSPLLANIYLHAFERIVNNPNGKFAQSNIRIVRYADDFVLMSTQRYSRDIFRYIGWLMYRMELRLNREKTSILHISKKNLFFLGFEIRKHRSKFNRERRNYTVIKPSQKSRSKLFTKIRELLAKRRHWKIEWVVYKLNELLIGWLNYFSINKVAYIWGTVRVMVRHLNYKLYKWLKNKGRQAHKSLRQRPYRNLVAYKNLLDLDRIAEAKVCASENACESFMKNSIGKPDEGKLQVRFDEGATRLYPTAAFLILRNSINFLS